MKLVDRVHGDYVHGRRVSVLARRIAKVLPPGATRVLDVGCGDGRLARLLIDLRPDLAIEGIDVLVREGLPIPVRSFDGTTIPHDDGSFDAAIFVDVLHHAADPAALLGEAARVARRRVIIKDHLKDRPFAGPMLGFMDRVGNARYGVALPYNYWRKAEWDAAFAATGLRPVSWETDLKIYPPWADWFFGGSLHFLAALEPTDRGHAGP